MKIVTLLFLLFAKLIGAVIVSNSKPSSLAIPTMNMCSSENEVVLEGRGEASRVLINPAPEERIASCSLRITAPANYFINLNFLETSVQLYKVLLQNKSKDNTSCPLKVYLPDSKSTPFWHGDLCSEEPLPDLDLLTPEFKIVWTPSRHSIATKGRKIVITAVGQGVVCKEPGQHTCATIGRIPLYCVSDELLCDGYVNCPKTSVSSSFNDEDEKLCYNHKRTQHPLIEIAEIYFQLRGNEEDTPISTTPKISFGDWREWRNYGKKTTLKPVIESKKADTISSILSKYGPWGYLMLGMLICGTVLMFCGLWECCFRKPKSTDDAPLQTQPTTVLIINHQQEETTNPMPPNYDELDQPPSYTTLFPNFKYIRPCLNIVNIDSGSCASRSPNSTPEVQSDNTNNNTNERNDSLCDEDRT